MAKTIGEGAVRKKHTAFKGQWAGMLIEMLRSPAYRVLSLSARRVMDRLQIEFAQHGGKDNGKLPCTYNQFEEYGVHRHGVSLAIRELEALGFIETTERGRRSAGEFRRPNKFRLTFRYTDTAAATDEWRKIKTVEEADRIAEQARAPRGCQKIKKPPPEKG